MYLILSFKPALVAIFSRSEKSVKPLPLPERAFPISPEFPLRASYSLPRSISSFMTFVMIAVVSNAIYYGFVEFGLDVLVIFMVVLMLRALNKPDNDTIYPKIYRGQEKRNKRKI